MITQYEAAKLVCNELPAVNNAVLPSRTSLRIYVYMNRFADITGELVQQRNDVAARKCFALAEQMFRQGDHFVRLLVENIFVFGFSSFLTVETTRCKEIVSMIPDVLYRVYTKQTMQSGC